MYEKFRSDADDLIDTILDREFGDRKDTDRGKERAKRVRELRNMTTIELTRIIERGSK